MSAGLRGFPVVEVGNASVRLSRGTLEGFWQEATLAVPVIGGLPIVYPSHVANSSVQIDGSPLERRLVQRATGLLGRTAPSHVLVVWSVHSLGAGGHQQVATSGSSVVLGEPGGRSRLADDARLAGRIRLARLKRAHFGREDRAQRIKRALRVLAALEPSPRLDGETWKWIAEDVDLDGV